MTVNEPQDQNRTVDDIPSAPPDSLDAGLVAGFGRAEPPPTSPGDTPPAPLSDATAPEQAGGLPAVPGYRVLREIARGGMGRVLAAHDLTLDRDVALKVLLPGASSDRFVRESKITARLPHPGIPPVYALGTLADGSPFLAMKLIAGRTLAEERKSADRPRLLQAFTQICQAVGFAHSRGIIHRDLKPGNVMVGAFGEVQVMDWGLAKDIDQASRERRRPEEEETPPGTAAGTDPNQTTDHRGPGESTDDQTKAGLVMGTPAYMAPEQARGEPTDARADVFALGAVLCAILTGRPPYSGKSPPDVIRRAGAADLGEAHARLDGCGADAELVALCRGCLSPSPADRPNDGQAVADALTAYLDGVQERLQSAQRERAVAVTREAEQRKRRNVQLVLTVVVVVALLGGGAVAWWRHEGRVRNAGAVAVLLDQCKEALGAGDAHRAQVALDAARKRSAEGGAEEQAGRLGRLEADLALLGELDAIDQYRWTWSENTFPNPVVVAIRTREALARFGVDTASVPADEEAERLSASAVRERIVSALDRLLLPIRLFPEEQRRYTPQLRADEAALVPKLAGVRALLRRIDADPYRDAVRDAILAEDRAKFVELVGQKAALEQPAWFTDFLVGTRLIANARGRELLQEGLSRQPDNVGMLMEMGLSTLGVVKEGVEDPLRWFQAAVAAAPRNSAARTNLYNALANKGKLEEALVCIRRAIELDGKNARAHANLGNALYKQKKLEEAIACYRKAIDLDPKLAEAHSNLGDALKAQGKVDEAIASCRTAIALDPKLALAHNNLGNALAAKGKVEEAIDCYRQAIELDPESASANSNLGAVLADKGKVEEAIACFRQAIELDPKYAPAHANLGLALYGKGKVDEATACFRKAIDLDPESAQTHNNLGNALKDKGKVDEAIACFRKAIELDSKLANAHGALGQALMQQGQFGEACQALRRCLELLPPGSPLRGPASRLLQCSHDNLGIALAGKGQLDEAIACFRKAIALDPKYARAHANLGTALH
jgi:tetratricopeptide (TPR) repeat protein/serine/threonine protein kinase